MEFHNGYNPIMQSNEADDVSFYTCNFGLSVAVPYYLPRGIVHKVRHHILDVFEPTHQVSINSVQIVSKKLPISEAIPPSADVIYG